MIRIDQEKVCCISDLHIGVHQNNVFWHNVTTAWASWLRDELTNKKIKDILICGDLFHYRDEISVNTLHIANEVLKLWKDFNIVMLVGNHDAYYKDRSDVNSISLFDGWANIRVISKVEQSSNFNKDITFVPWGTNIDYIPDSDIIFGHFEIETFKMNAHKVCDHGIKTKDLLNKAKLIISGHFHLRDERTYEKGTILYLGSPYQMDFGDVESTKGYYILDIPTSTYEFIENTISPIHKKVLLSEIVKREPENIRSMFTNNIVKFVVDKNIASDDIDTLLQKINAYKPLTLTVDYTANFNKFEIKDGDTDFTGIDISKAIEEFVNMLDIENKKDVIQYSLELYKKSK
jgi:DNA repair exonuclease SbcCD nuclease subunit